MRWNFRVIKNGDMYEIAEVFYDDDGNVEGWADSSGLLSWEKYEDLKGTVEYLQYAFHKPILVVDGDNLVRDNNEQK